MKKIIIFFFLFSFYSCFLTNKGIRTIDGVGNGNGGSNTNADTSINLDGVPDAADIGSDETESSHNDYSAPKGANPPMSHEITVGSFSEKESYAPNKIRVVEIKNTKVVKENSELSEGRIVYKIPDRMKIRSTYKVLVRISKSKKTISVYDNLDGDVRTSVIPTTETMEAKLIDLSPADNKAFEIINSNEGVQIIDSGDTYTEWSWAVTPVRVENSKLQIVISVIRNNNKKDIVYEDTVEIEKDIFVQISFFAKQYWQWLLSTLIVPFGIWWFNRKRKRKKQQ